jgi:hypothetical protein
LQIATIAILLQTTALSTAKRQEATNKKPAKKASSAKPTKTAPKSIVDEFAGLPEKDLEFIKELDKQFNLNGNKLKIILQKDNKTEEKAGKNNSKRTIDGTLG